MSRDQFDSALAEVICKYPAGAHEGWIADFGALDLPGVTVRKVWLTGDPSALIEARCQSEAVGLSGVKVAEGLKRFWEYTFFRAEPEKHLLTITEGAVVLEAFTIHAQQYVSVKVIVDMS